ncbi:hypothetical protein EJ03DRAFT_346782 [Teratosphaeria nubilosa]|uniref:GATA-type domain-containing protein n=1 Tax=Teratosphaeria nubilosa TaxID=161662 RepID=A0A6G1LMW5_9PEZI|nr:hypothetical protein EJ03DRAFT_346782 [Teratosphaeria nubilosa]
MDGESRRPQLPALSYLDVDKVKREEEAAYQRRNSGAANTLPPVTAASPTYPYPSVPPPPYSQPTPSSFRSNAWGSAQTGVQTPPESRRASGEKQESKQTTRQSLPSISEALGVDSQTYPTATPAPPAHTASAHAHQSQAPSGPPRSPASATKRSFTMEPPPPPQTYQSFPHAQQEPHPHTYLPQEAHRTPYAPERPPLHLPASESAARPTQPASTYPYPPTAPAGYDQPPAHPAGPMPPPSSVPYGFIPYAARYSQPPPPVSGTSGPIYQPSAHYPATPAPGWKAEAARYGPDDATDSRDYSTSVKRHLDMYDLEGSLNEIAQTSGILLDFSRRYGDRLHQSARSGPSLATLPGLVEVEDMISKSRVQLESLEKIRAVVLEQQAAYEQSIVDQRQAHKGIPEAPPPLAQDQEDEAKADMSSQDNKKRRGRAAPPGRCHSCNRAETPEWRRGPDGARTLCNACGLHYAKLTRKQQGANKTSNAGSSNLRPKEN